MNLTELGQGLGITSRRMLDDLVAALARKRLVRTERLKERGSPRVVYPVDSVRNDTDVSVTDTVEVRPRTGQEE